jgi:hypothetical protein
LFPISNIMSITPADVMDVPGVPTRSSEEAGKSLPFPIPLRPALFPTSYFLGLSELRTALTGGSGSWPRMASFSFSGGQNCCKQTLLKITVLPSCPARSCRRPVSTVPCSGFVAMSGPQSVDETRLTGCA